MGWDPPTCYPVAPETGDVSFKGLEKAERGGRNVLGYTTGKHFYLEFSIQTFFTRGDTWQLSGKSQDVLKDGNFNQRTAFNRHHFKTQNVRISYLHS